MVVPVPACASASPGCPLAQALTGSDINSVDAARGCCRQHAAAPTGGPESPGEGSDDAPAHGPTGSPCGLTCQFCGAPRPPLSRAVDARPAFVAVPYASPLSYG